MNESILAAAFNDNNWEPFIACLTKGETTIQELETVFLKTSFNNDIRTLCFLINAPETEINALMIAAIKGNLKMLKLIFEYGVTVNPTNNTALIYAAYFGQADAAKFLIDKGANPDFQNLNKNTALKMAVFQGHYDIAELLLERGANLYLEDEWSPTPLQLSYNNGNPKMISLLLEPRFQNKGNLDKSIKDRLSILTKPNNSFNHDEENEIMNLFLQGITNTHSKYLSETLVEAAEIANFKLVKKLLELGANPNYVDSTRDSFTPLMSAVVGRRCGISYHFTLVASSLAPKKKEEISLSENQFPALPPLTPEQLEQLKSIEKPGPHYEIINLLLKHGASPNFPSTNLQLHPAPFESYPSFMVQRNAMALAKIMEDQKLITLFEKNPNEILPKSKLGSIYIYDLFEKNRFVTQKIYTKVLNQILEGEQILHRGDLIINCDVPKGTEIRIIDGNIIIHGKVKGNAKISTSHMPLVRFRDDKSILLSSYATLTEAGHLVFANPVLIKGTHSPIKNDLVICGNYECKVPYVTYEPTITEHSITIDGDIADDTEIAAFGTVLVKGKNLSCPTPYQLDPDNGELLEVREMDAYRIFNAERNSLTTYENIFYFKKILNTIKHNASELRQLAHYVILFKKNQYLKLLANEKIDFTTIISLDFSNNSKCTILQLASSWNVEVVNMLLAANANPNDIPKQYFTETLPPLLIAVENNQAEIVKSLIQAKANVNYISSEGLTALNLAIIKGNKEIVIELLEHGADVDQSHEKTATPLQLCVDRGTVEILELLLKQKPNINYENAQGGTALRIAANQGKTQMVQLLLAHGASPTVPPSKYLNELGLAAIENHPGTVRFLLEQGFSMYINIERHKIPPNIQNLLKTIALERRAIRTATCYFKSLELIENTYANNSAIVPENYNPGQTRNFLMGFNLWKQLPKGTNLKLQVCRIAAGASRVPSDNELKRVCTSIQDPNRILTIVNDPIIPSKLPAQIAPNNLSSRKITDLELFNKVLQRCQINKESQGYNLPELALRKAAKNCLFDAVKVLKKIVIDLDINAAGLESGKTALDFAREGGHPELITFLEKAGAQSGKKFTM